MLAEPESTYCSAQTTRPLPTPPPETRKPPPGEGERRQPPPPDPDGEIGGPPDEADDQPGRERAAAQLTHAEPPASRPGARRPSRTRWRARWSSWWSRARPWGGARAARSGAARRWAPRP